MPTIMDKRIEFIEKSVVLIWTTLPRLTPEEEKRIIYV
jgi:hypothetical protein